MRLATQLCLTLCDLMDCSLPGSSVLADSPGKNTGVGCHALLQGIFPTQGSNPGLPHCRWVLYCLNHHVCILILSHFSRVRLFAVPWTTVHQAPLSMGFPRQEN